MRMRVLYISYDGMTDPLGQSQVLPYLRGIADEGFEIHLISFEKPEAFGKERQLIESLCEQSGITWYPLQYTKNPPVLSSIYDYRMMVKKAKELHHKYRFNLVHCRSYLPGMAGMTLKQSERESVSAGQRESEIGNRIKFLFDIRGFWADERVEGKLWNLRNPLFKIIYRYFKKKEKLMFKAADGIISLTRKAVPVILKTGELKAEEKPIMVIPCCVDTVLFNPENISAETKKNIRYKTGIADDAFVLTYLGGIGTWYKAEEMFDFFKRLLIRFPNAVFLLITKEPAASLYSIAENKNIPPDKIKIQPSARKNIPAYLSVADASIYFIMDSFSKQASSPTKQAEVMSMGIPLICNPGVGDSSDILIEGKSGYICNGYNISDYDKTISEFEYPVSENFRMHIRSEALHHFSLSDGIAKYLEMYRKLLYE